MFVGENNFQWFVHDVMWTLTEGVVLIIRYLQCILLPLSTDQAPLLWPRSCAKTFCIDLVFKDS